MSARFILDSVSTGIAIELEIFIGVKADSA